MKSDTHILTLSCPNRPGIVSKVTTCLFAHGGDITEAHQFDDRATGQFFMRIAFAFPAGDRTGALEADLQRLANELLIAWRLRRASERMRVILMVSKIDHCFVDLLYRWRIHELAMDIVGVISNHARNPAHDIAATPFHYLPVTAETKAAQEAQIKELVASTGADLVILARYMQVLSDDLAQHLSGRCINIHHSFLPSFKGAGPYSQAHARGVKLIGATAHYVTGDLDEGPIIEQDVERISHHDTPAALVRKGRDIERRVLARAVGFHLEGRVLTHGARTIVFRD
jgi:formyltetrahydrofolate deformylase